MSREAYFVRGYQRHVASLIAAEPLDRAMANSVGGDFETIGAIELAILIEAGLGENQTLIDIGCGSGRLSSQVTQMFADRITYIGTDIVPELLAYAKVKAAPSYNFHLVADSIIPAADVSAHFIVAFSVFTHLRQREIRNYLIDAHRVLRSGGKMVFSYFELLRHTKILAHSSVLTMLGRRPNVENHFASGRSIKRLAKASGLIVEALLPRRIGQSVAVLRKP